MKSFFLAPTAAFLLVVLAAGGVHLSALADTAEAGSSFWISARDESACIVSAVVQYDRRAEAKVRLENGIVGRAAVPSGASTGTPYWPGVRS